MRVGTGEWVYIATTSSTSYQYYVRTSLSGSLTFWVQKASYYKAQPSEELRMFSGTVTVAA
jgi:hypothetical protein